MDLRGYISKYKAEDPALAAVLELVQRHMTLTDERIRELAGRIPGSGSTVSISGESIQERTIDATKLKFAIIDEAIIGEAAIGTANIQDAAITRAKIALLAVGNAQIEDLSASKLTAGTIDAAVINVLNLNAGNITSGILSAALLAAASIDVTKLNIRTFITTCVFSPGPGPTDMQWTAGAVFFQGLTYAISSGVTTGNRFVYWDVGNTFFTSNTAYLPANTRFLVATRESGGLVSEVWRQAGGQSTVTTGVIVDNAVTTNKVQDFAITDAKIFNLDAVKITAGFLSASRIAAASITANKLNLRKFIADIIWTNNDPSPGSISWLGVIIYYDGNTYTPTGGNTSNRYIWWNVGDTGLSTGNDFTPANNRYPVAINDGGFVKEVWDNPLAGPIIQEANLSFGLISGVEPKLASVAAFNISSGVVPLKTTVANISGAGFLLKVTVYCNTTNSGPSTALRVSTTIDGGTVYHENIYATGTTFPKSAIANAQKLNGNGASAGNYITFDYMIGYASSLLVEVELTTASGSAGESVDVFVNYAEKL